MLEAAIIFQDHMTLQRNKRVAVWGAGNPGAEVRVEMQGQAAVGTVNSDGKWTVRCGPFAASTGETMTVRSGGEVLTFADAQVGEVWLAGGQSNMEFHMYFDLEAAAEKAKPGCGDIRFFDYPEVSYPGQIDEAPYREQYARWRKAVPEELDRFSAVGYWFAREIHEKLGVPVAIVGCNWGGTPASAWMSREDIAAAGGRPYLDDYDRATENLDLAAYETAFRADPTAFRVDHLEDPVSKALMLSTTIESAAENLKELGIAFDLSAAPQPLVGPKYPQRPAGLYESMLLPLVPYGIRGFLWYQGETDGDGHPECYAALFPALIANWRRLWGEELPFLFVQLAPFQQWLGITSGNYHIIRAAQQQTADTVPGAWMAVTSDAGSEFDIHPKMKRPVGHRLALQARKHVYGEKDLLAEAPRPRKMKVSEGKILLTFDYAGDGLRLTDRTPFGEARDPARFCGVTVSQSGAELDPADIRAEAWGNQLLLTSPEIRAGRPTEVYIGKTDWYAVNLLNSADIPARPGKIEG